MSDDCPLTELPRETCAHCLGQDGWAEPAYRMTPEISRASSGRVVRLDYSGVADAAWSPEPDEAPNQTAGKTGQPCAVCEAPARFFLCDSCAGRLDRALGDAGGLLHDLELTATGQVRYRRPDRVRSSSQPAGITLNPIALAAHRALIDAVTSAAARVSKHPAAAPGGPQRRTGDPWAAVLALQHHLSRLVDSPDAGQLYQRIVGAVDRALRVVDRPVDLVNIGPCDQCGRDLRMEPLPTTATETERENASTRCGFCGVVVHVAAHIRQLLAEADDLLMTAAELAKALIAANEPVTGDQIATWAKRGQIARHERLDWSDSVPPRLVKSVTYRVGEVRQLVAEKQLRARVTRRR